jgi:hypothetical protein
MAVATDGEACNLQHVSPNGDSWRISVFAPFLSNLDLENIPSPFNSTSHIYFVMDTPYQVSVNVYWWRITPFTTIQVAI